MSMYSILNKVSKYIYFYLSKNITLYTFGAFFKSSKGFCVSLNVLLLSLLYTK